MSSQDRYDTLVIKNANIKLVPREAAGGEVVSWAAGHALAEMHPLEEFVRALADGDMFCSDDVEAEARRVLNLSGRQRDAGYVEDEQP
ncbi:MAG: hypothetical protein NDI93_01470 [Pseudomonas sp.]|nr:hypothetical protein [Pseudomonas sp.]